MEDNGPRVVLYQLFEKEGAGMPFNFAKLLAHFLPPVSESRK